MSQDPIEREAEIEQEEAAVNKEMQEEEERLRKALEEVSLENEPDVEGESED